MRGCMTNCNTTTDCSGFSYGYSGDEPTDSDTTTLKGICYFKKGTYQLIGNGQNNVAMAVSVGTAAAAAPTTSFVGIPTSKVTISRANQSFLPPGFLKRFHVTRRRQYGSSWWRWCNHRFGLYNHYHYHHFVLYRVFSDASLHWHSVSSCYLNAFLLWCQSRGRVDWTVCRWLQHNIHSVLR